MHIYLFKTLNLFYSPFFFVSLILPIQFLDSSFNWTFRITYLIVEYWTLGFEIFRASTCFFPWSLIVFVCFSKALRKGELVKLVFSITLIWSRGSICSPIRFSYLSILPDNNADFLAASLLILYYSFCICNLIINCHD